MAVKTDLLKNKLAKYKGDKGALIQALLEIQSEFNWISDESINQVAETLEVPRTRVYRVASFYKAMSLKPRGRHIIRVCLGTACHVRGGERIMDRVKEILDISENDTTPDMKFTVERVNCLGCCALGPVMVIDGAYHGKVEPNKISELLNNCK